MPITPTPATTLRDIRDVCHPRPLQADQLDRFYVETDDARDPHCAARQSIKSVLSGARERKRVLIYGHRGCGKSTELAKLAKELDGGWLCVGFSVLNELPPTDVHAEEILLIVASQLVRVAETEPALKSLEHSEAVKKVYEWFAGVERTSVSNQEFGAELEAGISAGTGRWLSVLGELFAKLRTDIKYRSSHETKMVEVVRKRPGDLIEQINRIVESVEQALGDRQLLIIVEDLDKLSIADARKVFIENSQLLTGIRANIIYTIPIFTFYSPDASSMKAAFDEEFPLPMIKVTEPDGSEAKKGRSIVRQIIHRRVAKEAIEADALELLIEKTGGVLRHVFEVLQTTCNMTSLRELPIRKSHIEYGLQRLKADLGTQIALPSHLKIEGLNDVTQLYRRLEECAKRLKENKPCPPTGEAIVQVLLQSCALVEYNGTRWLGVHPLVLEFLKDLGHEV